MSEQFAGRHAGLRHMIQMPEDAHPTDWGLIHTVPGVCRGCGASPLCGVVTNRRTQGGTFVRGKICGVCTLVAEVG